MAPAVARAGADGADIDGVILNQQAGLLTDTTGGDLAAKWAVALVFFDQSVETQY